ncbi:hypothetical protein NE857_21655 [Nocardiopsis exhalans]|uniref:Uncharacterized protein n=1 Tax=Nocardiopsis exhalans TaxID=163604 RepID=A0ABY5D0X6_9ACTN|nr:hypothetical protein [Nocardiopsis exhalans]USY17924.1 hypothetical protein NE857_21655 [Nocardiopsis exhalans]
MNNDDSETVTAYTHDVAAYEMDHLDITHPGQCREYAVCCDGPRLARRVAAISAWPRSSRPSMPMELFPLAWALVAVSSDAARGPAQLTKKDESCP